MESRDFHRLVEKLLTGLFPEHFDKLSLDESTGLYSDLGLQSIEIVSLFFALDSEVGLRMPPDEIAVSEVRTVGQLRGLTRGQTSRPDKRDPLAESLLRGTRRKLNR